MNIRYEFKMHRVKKKTTKFTKQDSNNETIMLTEIIIIFSNKYPTSICRTINFTHIKKTLFYLMLHHVEKVARNKCIRIFIITF